MSTASSHFESDSIRADLSLPAELREELRDPLGDVMSGEEAISVLKPNEKLYTIGDQCTLTFVEEDIIPHLMIVDYQIKRRPDPQLRQRFENVQAVRKQVWNPPAMITKELWAVIFESVHSEQKVLLEVDGEEDLAALPCISLAENGNQVVYGLPDEGLVLVSVDENSKNRVFRILERMRESNAS